MQFATKGDLGTAYSSKGIAIIQKTFNVANVLGYPNNVDEDLSAIYSTNPV